MMEYMIWRLIESINLNSLQVSDNFKAEAVIYRFYSSN